MCDQRTVLLINEVVNSRVNANEMFTAFDISLRVKAHAQRMALPAERHRDMKGFIHQALENHVHSGLFQKTLRNVGSNLEAYVYHPFGTNAADYVPLDRHDNYKNNPTPQVVAPSAFPATATLVQPQASPLPAGAVKPDSRGTVCVLKDLIEGAGLKDRVYVFVADVPTKHLVVRGTDGADKLTSYTVDKYGNVRITKAVLSLAGCKSPAYAFVRSAADEILVLPL